MLLSRQLDVLYLPFMFRVQANPFTGGSTNIEYAQHALWWKHCKLALCFCLSTWKTLLRNWEISTQFGSWYQYRNNRDDLCWSEDEVEPFHCVPVQFCSLFNSSVRTPFLKASFQVCCQAQTGILLATLGSQHHLCKISSWDSSDCVSQMEATSNKPVRQPRLYQSRNILKKERRLYECT